MEHEKQTEAYVRQYVDFLDDSEDQAVYTNLVKSMIEDKKRRIIVNINDLRRKIPDRATGLLNNSFEEHMAFQTALKQFVDSIDAEYAKQNLELFIGFEGSFGNKHVTPRTLCSRHLGCMVCLEGIVTKCSLVRPKIVKSVHYCPTTKIVMERTYSDLTSFDAFPTSLVYPTHDESGNPLETEYGLSVYKNHQTLTIQEMPEKAPAGQMPRSVDVIADNDLVDLCKPGDRVYIVGSFRCLPGKQDGYSSGTFRSVLIANHITLLNQEDDIDISSDVVKICKKLAKRNSRKDIFELLSKSLAPSIYGHDYIKKAILCLLLGGMEKILPNGTRLRGDINILLIGDPSVAKSQLLRYVLCTAPKAIPTTGRGSSGVGLTAAVTTDAETGERSLEAGAMVLADRGVICIDEFDKMSDIDRTAIHEVMEQGRVTIAKAGIHATLNARCSVLAAANPVYGRYAPHKTPMENIGLQDSLLSRFDLLFVILDTIDTEQDHIVSDHVVRMHRYRNPNEQDGEALPFNSTADLLSTKNLDDNKIDKHDEQIFEKYDPLLHGNMRSKTEQILTVNFMRKYIHIARWVKPTLTEEACKAIAEEYSKLRSEEMIAANVARTQPITARTLETLIRLSTAHAKARLSKYVEIEDTNAAIELVQYAYFKRVLEKEKKKRRRHDSIGSNADSGDNDDNDSRKKKRSRKDSSLQQDPYEYDSDDSHIDEAVMKRMTRSKTETQSVMETIQEEPATITDERFALFRKHLHTMFNEQRTQTLTVAKVKESINKQYSPQFSDGEIDVALSKMMDENQIMVNDGNIFLI